MIDYADLKAVKYFTFLPDEVNEILEKVEKDIFKRLDLLRQYKCKNYEQYNERFPHCKMNYHLVIIEELMILNKDKDIMKTLKRCLSVCRATGTYFILTSQRFDANTLDGAVKTNCDLRISFKVKSKIDSMIILDEAGAEQLNEKGRCLFNDNGEFKEVQCFYVLDIEITEQIEKYPKKEIRNEVKLEREWLN